jgi:hypothetical protein
LTGEFRWDGENGGISGVIRLGMDVIQLVKANKIKE